MSSARRLTSGMQDTLRSLASIIMRYILTSGMQGTLRSLASIIVRYISSFSAFVVLNVYTYRPCVLGTLFLSQNKKQAMKSS